MSYVQRILQPGEILRHTASIHWIVYWLGTLFLFLALVCLIYGEFFAPRMVFWQVTAGLLAVIGFVLLIPEWFTWWTTEIAITNLRIIYKTGFIRRRTNEMNMDKVESVRVDQSILGRFLDYGDVSIIGTGEGGIGRHVVRSGEDERELVERKGELRHVANPLELRNHITGV